MKVKVDSEKMMMIGNNVIEKSYEFANKARELENEVEKIMNAWEGDDATKYIKLLNDNYITNLEELARIIDNYGQYIKTAALIYTNFEQGTIDDYKGGPF